MIEIEVIINEIKLSIDRIVNINTKLFRYQHYAWYNYQLIENENHIEIVLMIIMNIIKKTILQKINKTIEEVQWLKSMISITDEIWACFRENTLKEANMYYQYEDKTLKQSFLRNYELIEDLKFNFLKYILLTYNIVFIETNDINELDQSDLDGLIETKYKNILLTGSKLEKIFGLFLLNVRWKMINFR